MRSLSILLLFAAVIPLSAQQSGPLYYRSGVMNGNNIMTVFGNWGVIGQPADTRPRGAWMRPSNGYIGDMSILIGIELPIQDYTGDGKPDTIHSVITSPVARPASSFDTDDWSGGGKPYTFMPVDGFANPLQTGVAMSNAPQTWPSSWNGTWKGLSGNGQVAADLEAYFQLDDRQDERFSAKSNNPEGIVFRPDTSDTTRKGQGIRVDVRYLQYTHPLFADILFRVYDIRNESSYDYSKVVFGNLGGILIGVTGSQNYAEYDDDYSVLYKKEQTVVAGDFSGDNSRNPFWRGRVGKIGDAFLVSPANGAVGGYRYITPANDIALGTDKVLWSLLTPGYYQVPASIVNDTTVLNGADCDYIFGSRYFSLPSKGMKRIVSAIAYDHTAPGIFQKMKLGKVLANHNFDLPGMLAEMPLPQFAMPTTISGTVPLQWPQRDAAGSVELCFSADNGVTWSILADSLPDNGAYQWNTALLPDCAFGVLRIFHKGPNGEYTSVRQSMAPVTINNAGNGRPFVRIIPLFNDTTRLSAAVHPLPILAGDPDNASLNASIWYSIGGPFVKLRDTVIASGAAVQMFAVPLGAMPNGKEFRLRIAVSDGEYTWSDSTDPFTKENVRPAVAPAAVHPVSGSASSLVSFGIVDRAQTTTDTYIISFNDTAADRPKRMTVFNTTKNVPALLSVPLINNTESPVFDGVRMAINDRTTQLDSAYWNAGAHSNMRGVMEPVSLTHANGSVVLGYPRPADYRIIFGPRGRMIDLFPYVGVTTPEDSTDMIVVNTATGSRVPFYCLNVAPSYMDFYCVENIVGTNRMTWRLALWANGDSVRTPVAGDTITFTTSKGLSVYDTIRLNNVALGVPSTVLPPDRFALHQNYPNPFNPTTAIAFELPRAGMVTLTIYDVLGREVRTLVNEYRTAGYHRVSFDALGLASGLYFYRLQSAGFSGTKKMMLIR